MAGRGLGTLTLDLAVKTGMFTAGLDKAGRELDARAKKMQKRMYDLGSAIGTALKVGAGIAAAGMALYIKNTIEAEKVQAQLVSRIKDTASAAGRSIQQLNAQAAKLQGQTVFDDESIGEAQAALLTFTNVVGENFDRTIEAATDLATVMGTDVADAARLLGKALSDPEKGIGALRKAGITLTEDQKKLVVAMQDTGHISEAQGVILDALAGKMGTAAEASRNTLGGALQALTNSFNNLLEGNGGDDGVVGARDAIDSLNNTLNDPGLKRGVDNLVSGFAYVAEKAAITATAIANLIAGVDAFGRSAAQASYDTGIAKEQQLKEEIAAGGRSPFAAGGGRTVATLQAELAVVKQSNAAYRQLSQAKSQAAAPAGVSANGKTTIYHDPDLWMKGGKGGGGNTKAKVDEVAQAYQRMNEQMAETIALFNQTGEAAKVRYEIEHGELAKLAPAQQQELLQQAQKIDQLNAEKVVREEMVRADEKAAEAAADHAKAVKELLEDLAFETSLTAMSNEEKERAIMLRQTLAGATAEEAKQITASVDALLHAQKANGELASAMDEFRGNFEDTVVDVVTGAKSIGEAFKSLADMVIAQIARMIAQQLTSSLFGAPGSTGGGSGGGWLSSLFGIFSGGGSPKGYATGGNPPVGVPYLVGEHGPELRIDRSPSTIVPNGKFGGHSITVNINGGSDPRATAQQTANEVRRVLAFSGRSG